MVSEVKKGLAIRFSVNSDIDWFQCNQCRDMFSNMIHFEGWDFYYCIPRKCPNCGVEFENGMEVI